MWPTMIEGPSSPGVGAPVYQPAGNPDGGTWSEPSAFRPSFINVLLTPMLGTVRLTGADLLMGAVPSVRCAVDDDETGDAAITGADDIGMADPLSIASGGADVASEATARVGAPGDAVGELAVPHPAAQTAS